MLFYLSLNPATTLAGIPPFSNPATPYSPINVPILQLQTCAVIVFSLPSAISSIGRATDS